MWKASVKVVVAVAALAALLEAPGAHAQSKTAGERIDDATIAATIKAGLLDHKSTSAMQINVESHRATVQLSGFVESEAEREAAGQVAAGVRGVREVVNSLAVAPKASFGTRLEDSLLTGKVKAALVDSKDVRSLQINVETRGGVTQLAGFVSSAAMKERAGQVAGDVNGVRKVENVLVVIGGD